MSEVEDAGESREKRIILGSVRDTPLAKQAGAVARAITDHGIAASRVAGNGGRLGSTGAGGVMGGAGAGGAGGGLPSALATGSPLSVFQYTLSRADRLAMFRYFQRCFVDPKVPITLEDGTERALGEMRPGDRVINALGGVTEVEAVTQQYYEGSVTRFRVAGMPRLDGLTVTPDHPFRVVRAGKIRRVTYEDKKHIPTLVDIDFTPEWVEAKDLRRGDCLVVPGYQSLDNESSVARSRLLGYYLAEGDSNYKANAREEFLSGVTWSLGVHEEELIQEIMDLVELETGEPPARYGPYDGRETVVALRLKQGNEAHRELAQWLVAHGGEGSRGKRLSPWAFRCSPEWAKHLLACWLNGDGNRNLACAGQLSGTTTSGDLAHQLYLMMVRVGLCPAKYEGRSTRDGEDKGPNWSVYIPALYGNVLCAYAKWEPTEKAFRHRKHNVGGNMLLPVTTVESLDHAGPIYNLQTRGENYDERTFLVHGLATHNTDPVVGRAIELHSELPLSRLSIGPPKGPNAKQNREVNRIYENMVERLGLMEFLLEVAREFWTCVHPSNHVRMGDGTSKRICEVREGDLVLTAEGNVRPVLEVMSREVDESLYVIRARGLANPLRLTGNHPVKTPRGFVKAEDLTREDSLMSWDSLVSEDPEILGESWRVSGECLLEILSIERESYQGLVHNLNVAGDHTYVVENAGVHNCGDVNIWHEWNPEIGEWDDVYILPVEYCHLPGARVTLEDNTQKRIEHVEPGDRVVTHLGRVGEVSANLSREVEEEIFSLKVYGTGQVAEVTGDHPYWVQRKGRNLDSREWIRVRDFKSGDRVEYRVPLEVRPSGHSERHCELLGLVVADGYVSGDGEFVGLCFGKSERSQAERALELVRELFPPEPCDLGRTRWGDLKEPRLGPEHRGEFHLRYENAAFVKFCEGIGRGASRKRVPEWVLYGSEAQILAFWRGYDQGDGHLTARGDWVANSASFQLIQDLRWLCTRLGIWCRDQGYIGTKGATWEEVIEDAQPSSRDRPKGFRITVPRGYAPMLHGGEPVLSRKGRGAYFCGKGWRLDRVRVSRVRSFKTPVYHLTVPGDESYIVNNAAVHNCHSIINPFKRRSELILWCRPLVDTASIRRMTDRDLYMLAGDPDLENLIEQVEDDVPADLKRLLDFGEAQVLNTDPKKGSFCYHIARNRPPNEAYGMGLLERCMETLLRLENLKNAQLQISGRNMQPKHLIYGEGLSAKEIDDLRAQVDLALLENVDFPIVTNYAVTWQTIGANDRLLQVDSEYTMLQESLATGLGTTREMLTGQATYGGQRITLELMNTQYLTFRELIKDYVERCIFRPVAEAKGHYFDEELDIWVKCKPVELEAGDEVIQEHDGTLRKRAVQINKVYNHSRLRFNRLSIRDNAEVYEQLFQLHQKGSLALRYLLDLHNIDSEENNNAILEDLATPRDPTFNRLVENIYPAIAPIIIQETDIVDRVIKGLNLDRNSHAQNEPSPGADGGGGMGGMDVGGGDLGGGDDGGGGFDQAVPDGMDSPPPDDTPAGPQGDQGPDDVPQGGGLPPAPGGGLPPGMGGVSARRLASASEPGPVLSGKPLTASQVETIRVAARRAAREERAAEKEKRRVRRRREGGAGESVVGEGV